MDHSAAITSPDWVPPPIVALLPSSATWTYAKPRIEMPIPFLTLPRSHVSPWPPVMARNGLLNALANRILFARRVLVSALEP